MLATSSETPGPTPEGRSAWWAAEASGGSRRLPSRAMPDRRISLVVSCHYVLYSSEQMLPEEVAMVSLRGRQTQAMALAPPEARHDKVVRVVEHSFDLVVIE
jgi:hypothetical protein